MNRPVDGPVVHTEECQKAEAGRLHELALYLGQWPNHCVECNGWGFQGSAACGPEDVGPTPCEKCYDLNHCPRCSNPMAFGPHCDSSETCRFCGFNVATGTGAPNVWDDCSCNYAEEADVA